MPRLAFYGSSLVSSYWNGAATYYRGLLQPLAALGWDVTFYEPDAYDRQARRDIDPPDWARVVVYPATNAGLRAVLDHAADADVVVKASGVGVFDTELVCALTTAPRPGAVRVFWDVDAPATIAEMRADAAHPLRRRLPELDMVNDLWRRAAGHRSLPVAGRSRVRADLQCARSCDAFPCRARSDDGGRSWIPRQPHAGSGNAIRSILLPPGSRTAE